MRSTLLMGLLLICLPAFAVEGTKPPTPVPPAYKPVVQPEYKPAVPIAQPAYKPAVQASPPAETKTEPPPTGNACSCSRTRYRNTSAGNPRSRTFSRAHARARQRNSTPRAPVPAPSEPKVTLSDSDYEKAYVLAITDRLQHVMKSCVTSKSSKIFSIFMEVDEMGRVFKVTTDITSGEGACIQQKFIGAKGPPPPNHPFRVTIDMDISE